MLRLIAWLVCTAVVVSAPAVTPTPLVRVGGPDIEDIAYSPDGRTLAVATMRAIELLDSETGVVMDRLEPGGYRVMYSQDGEMLAAVNGPARFWNAHTGAPIGATAVDVDGGAVAFLPGTGLFAYGESEGHNTVFLWDVREARVDAYLESDPDRAESRARGRRPPAGPREAHIRVLAVDATGGTLAAGTAESGIVLWDMTTLKVIQQYDSPWGGFQPWMELSPGGRRLVARDGPQGVRVWDTRTGEKWRQSRFGDIATRPSPALSVDGGRLFLGVGFGFVHVVELHGMTSQAVHVGRVWPGEYPGGWNEVTSVAVSPDGATFATIVNEARIVLWDAETYERRRTIDHGWSHDGVTGVYLRERAQVVTADWGDTVLHFWDAETGRLAHSTELQFRVNQILASPDESTLAVVTHEEAHVLHAADGRHLYEVIGHNPRVHAVSFSPSGRYLAAGGHELTVHDASSGKIISWIDASYTSQIVFSLDEGQVATDGDRDEGPRIWDVDTGKLVSELDGPGRVVATPGGFLHARGTAFPARERWTEVVDVTTGHRIALTPGPRPASARAFFNRLRFHPSGGLLGFRDRPLGGEETARFHDATTGELLAVSPLVPWSFTDDGDHILARTPEGRRACTGWKTSCGPMCP